MGKSPVRFGAAIALLTKLGAVVAVIAANPQLVALAPGKVVATAAILASLYNAFGKPLIRTSEEVITER